MFQNVLEPPCLASVNAVLTQLTHGYPYPRLAHEGKQRSPYLALLGNGTSFCGNVLCSRELWGGFDKLVDLFFFFFSLTKVLLRLTSFWRLKAVSFWCLQHGRPAPPRRICTQGASCFCDLSSSFCKAFLGGLSVLVMRVDVELGVTSCWRLSDGGSGRAHARVRAHIHMGPRGGSPLTWAWGSHYS